MIIGNVKGNEFDKIISDSNEKIVIKKIDVSKFDDVISHITSVEEIDDKVIRFIERQVRTSYEYRSYINYMKSELDLTRCSIMDGIDTKRSNISLEFHHYPFNLYEITDILSKALLNGKTSVSTLDIANLIMAEHFRHNVGLVPLTKTLHEMAHSKSIVIPNSKIVGNYKEFMIKYSNYISADIKERINNMEMLNDDTYAKMINSNKLKNVVTNYDINYIKDEDE